jgi:hypothetical protein
MVAQLRQATRSTGVYVNYCVWGPPNPISYELVQHNDICIVRASTLPVAHLGCKEQQT